MTDTTTPFGTLYAERLMTPAVAAPMPDAPPVITATLPLKREPCAMTSALPRIVNRCYSAI